jgi:hypothetical protein
MMMCQCNYCKDYFEYDDHHPSLERLCSNCSAAKVRIQTLETNLKHDVTNRRIAELEQEKEELRQEVIRLTETFDQMIKPFDYQTEIENLRLALRGRAIRFRFWDKTYSCDLCQHAWSRESSENHESTCLLHVCHGFHSFKGKRL